MSTVDQPFTTDIFLTRVTKILWYSGVILTKLNILDSFDEIKICTGYSHSKRILYYYLPSLHSIQGKLDPIYEEFPGPGYIKRAKLTGKKRRPLLSHLAIFFDIIRGSKEHMVVIKEKTIDDILAMNMW
ncbi:AMPSase [Dirofilaria immitis]|nr:AMPSase [Dirofilaria immitis]